jgi:serine/threonine protein kinase
LISSRGEAFIADLDSAKVYNSFTSAKKLSDITTTVGTPKWMSPEMREAWSNDVNTELPKSDIFSLGLIFLFCIDTPSFNDKLLPILSQFKTIMNKKEVADHLRNLEEHLHAYLEDFRIRNLSSPSNIKFFYILKSMLSFSPGARPSIQQLYEDFPIVSSIQV